MNLERSPRPQNMQVWADMVRTVESIQSVTGIHRRFPVGLQDELTDVGNDPLDAA